MYNIILKELVQELLWFAMHIYNGSCPKELLVII